MKSFLNLFSEMIETFAISLAIFLAVYAFLAFPEVVVGASMEPTLYTGERLLVERLSPKFHRLKKSDIIIFNPPGNNNIDYVKRIIGLPGEKVEIKDCFVRVILKTGEKVQLEEKYLPPSVCTKDVQSLVADVPDKYYFVLGDNRLHSADSRVFGPLSEGRIDGKVFLRFWPPTKIGPIS